MSLRNNISKDDVLRILGGTQSVTQDELIELRALRDAIPGDDKLDVIKWCVEYARASVMSKWGHATDVLETCPPSVRAALRSEVQS